MTVPGQIQGADNSTSPFGEKKCEVIFKGSDIGVKNHVHFCKLTIDMITNVWYISGVTLVLVYNIVIQLLYTFCSCSPQVWLPFVPYNIIKVLLTMFPLLSLLFL